MQENLQRKKVHRKNWSNWSNGAIGAMTETTKRGYQKATIFLIEKQIKQNLKQTNKKKEIKQ